MNPKNTFRAVGSAPFDVVNVTTKAIDFQSLGASLIGISDLPPWILGGVPLGIIGVSISSDEKVSVEFPTSVDGDTGMLVWNAVQKLPQQYVVNVTAGTDGTLSANNTLAQLQSVMQAYGTDTDISGAALINAAYNGKLYYMSAATGTSMTFTATTENGLETLTVSNDGKEGSTDVWTHTVTPIGNKVVVTLTRQNNKYTPSIGAWAINSAAEAGKNVVLKDPTNSSEIPLVYSMSYDVGIATFSSVEQMSSIRQGIGSPYVSTWEIRGENTVTIYQTPLPPAVSSSDNGKFLRVVDGQWAAEAVANAKGVSF